MDQSSGHSYNCQHNYQVATSEYGEYVLVILCDEMKLLSWLMPLSKTRKKIIFSNFCSFRYEAVGVHCLLPFTVDVHVKSSQNQSSNCVEEFEEKLNKFHAERKEQDATTRNAMSYHKKVGKLRSIFRDKKGTVENGRNDNDTEDEASEVINPSQSEGSGFTTTEIDQAADHSEVLSPKTSRKDDVREEMKPYYSEHLAILSIERTVCYYDRR
ncbi:hypothetical protein KSP39_PZI022572 [Platanthera zijinensis]|uniref:Uncharacterized protein n=1 Tax=Platanthera zijinensis TaxID=2320716 RepID=A0AAP0AVW2_9ASPA